MNIIGNIKSNNNSDISNENKQCNSSKTQKYKNSITLDLNSDQNGSGKHKLRKL